MKTIAWNMFSGFYVVTPDDSVFDGYKFLFWAETVDECEEWIKDYENNI